MRSSTGEGLPPEPSSTEWSPVPFQMLLPGSRTGAGEKMVWIRIGGCGFHQVAWTPIDFRKYLRSWARHLWLMLATQEVEISRIKVQSQPWANSLYILKKPIIQKDWWSGSKCRPWAQALVLQKKKVYRAVKRILPLATCSPGMKRDRVKKELSWGSQMSLFKRQIQVSSVENQNHIVKGPGRWSPGPRKATSAQWT
jgi:hypothetical protein